MRTSGIEKRKNRAVETAFAFLMASLICLCFGAVYELFSYGVYSFYMIYAFAYPLVGGTLPYLLLGVSGSGWYPGSLCRSLYHAGLATLTVGSLVKGVLEIYGTTNALIEIYWIAGVLLIVSAFAAALPFHRLQAAERKGN